MAAGATQWQAALLFLPRCIWYGGTKPMAAVHPPQAQDAVEEFSKYSTFALFNFVDLCDGIKPGFNPAAPIPALPVDSQVGGSMEGL